MIVFTITLALCAIPIICFWEEINDHYFPTPLDVLPLDKLEIETKQTIKGYNVAGDPYYNPKEFYIYTKKLWVKYYFMCKYNEKKVYYSYCWTKNKNYATQFNSLQDAQKMIHELRTRPNVFRTF